VSGFSPSVARYRLVSATQKINSVSNDGTDGAGCVGVDGLLGGVDGVVGGFDGLVGGFDGLVGGVDGLVGGVDGLVGGVDGLVGGLDGLLGGVDGSVGGVAGSLGGVEGSIAGVAGLLGGAAGLLGVPGLFGGVNGLLAEGPVGEPQADISAVVATAIEITRRNRIGTRVTPLGESVLEQTAGHSRAIRSRHRSRHRANDLAECRAAR